jgi:hypothetical protein
MPRNFFTPFRSLMTTPEDAEIQITRCIPLVVDRCLVLYQKKQEVHMSVISLDLNKNSCELIGSTYRIPNCWKAWEVGMSVTSAGVICLKAYHEGRTRLYQFKIDHSTLNFELQTVFSVPGCTRFHRIVDECCIFVEYISTRARIENILG